jgi:uncharacterized protein YebE (UPF0316 family)
LPDIIFLDSPFFSLVLIPLLIFLARITDVTIGTMRIIFVSRGLGLVAAFTGFVEVLIWLFAIGQIMSNLDNWTNYVAYAGGFAVGNFIGIKIEQRVALGYQVVRIITQRNGTSLEEKLRHANFIVTAVDAEGGRGPVKVLFTVVKRKTLPWVLELIKTTNPLAYYTVEDLRSVRSAGPIPTGRTRRIRLLSFQKEK